MDTYNSLTLKRQRIDTAIDICNDLRWRFDNLQERMKDYQKEIAEVYYGEVDSDMEFNIALCQVQIDVYQKVFDMLENIK